LTLARQAPADFVQKRPPASSGQGRALKRAIRCNERAPLLTTIEAKPLFRQPSRLTVIRAAAESHDLAIGRDIAEMIAADAVVAFGVSGGTEEFMPPRLPSCRCRRHLFMRARATTTANH